MKTDKLLIAFEKAKEVNDKLIELYPTYNYDFIPLEHILNVVKMLSGYDKITILRQSFSKIRSNDESFTEEMTEFGAMLKTEEHKDKDKVSKIALVIINQDLSDEMQRFSVVHELGHLITEIPNFVYDEPNDDVYTLSAHINSDITFLSEADYQDSDYLLAEQIANIFALLVLIRDDIKIRDLIAPGVQELSKRYGVTEDALYSRMLLSEVDSSEGPWFSA